MFFIKYNPSTAQLADEEDMPKSTVKYYVGKAKVSPFRFSMTEIGTGTSPLLNMTIL